jgi:hypothetical protein
MYTPSRTLVNEFEVTPAEMDKIMANGATIKLVIINNRWYSTYEIQEPHKIGRTIVTIRKAK